MNVQGKWLKINRKALGKVLGKYLNSMVNLLLKREEEVCIKVLINKRDINGKVPPKIMQKIENYAKLWKVMQTYLKVL